MPSKVRYVLITSRGLYTGGQARKKLEDDYAFFLKNVPEKLKACLPSFLPQNAPLKAKLLFSVMKSNFPHYAGATLRITREVKGCNQRHSNYRGLLVDYNHLTPKALKTRDAVDRKRMAKARLKAKKNTASTVSVQASGSVTVTHVSVSVPAQPTPLRLQRYNPETGRLETYASPPPMKADVAALRKSVFGLKKPSRFIKPPQPHLPPPTPPTPPQRAGLSGYAGVAVGNQFNWAGEAAQSASALISYYNDGAAYGIALDNLKKQYGVLVGGDVEEEQPLEAEQPDVEEEIEEIG